MSIKDFDVHNLEQDLIGNAPDTCVPHVAAKLLAALTGDRSINDKTWESRLRREYVKRDPEGSKLGYEPIKRPKGRGPRRPVGYVVVSDEEGGSPSNLGPMLPPSVALLRSETTEAASPSSPGGDYSSVDGAGTPGGDDEVDPDAPEPIPWSNLSAYQKLKALHALCEWQFSSVADIDRFRRLIDGRSGVPPDPASWRMESCGMDKPGNEYWYIGDGPSARLWVKRMEPKPARPPKKKVEATPNRKGGKKGAKASHKKGVGKGKKRARDIDEGEDDDDEEDEVEEVASARRGGHSSRRKPATPPVNAAGRPARASALAASKAKPSPYAIKRPRLLGVRTSSRLRHSDGDDEWQEMPPEWFDDPANAEAVYKALQDEEEEEKAKGSKAMGWGDDPEKMLKAMNKKKGRKSEVDSPAPSGSRTRDMAANGTPSNGMGRGGRRSSRRSAAAVEEEWEEVPKEWLEPKVAEAEAEGEDSAAPTVVLAEEDEKMEDGESEEKEEEEGEEEKKEEDEMDVDSAEVEAPPEKVNEKEEKESKQVKEEEEKEVVTEDENPELKGHPLDPEWIEWEAICCSFEEWQAFSLTLNPGNRDKGERNEKALLEFVVEEVIPMMMEAHQHQEKERRIQEAVALRKRSSRIAVKELEQENAQKLAEEEAVAREQRARQERVEARQRAEEERRQKEEELRLQRIQEREERVALREAQIAAEREAEAKREERARLRAEAKSSGNAVKIAKREVANSVAAASSDEDWELNCEICGVMGKNMDDGSEVICCDKCEKWQHLACHNKAAELLKRPRTDWATADFLCAACAGVPIPRALRSLRTHINGKPKPKPRPRVKKSDVAPNTPSSSNAQPGMVPNGLPGSGHAPAFGLPPPPRPIIPGMAPRPMQQGFSPHSPQMLASGYQNGRPPPAHYTGNGRPSLLPASMHNGGRFHIPPFRGTPSSASSPGVPSPGSRPGYIPPPPPPTAQQIYGSTPRASSTASPPPVLLSPQQQAQLQQYYNDPAALVKLLQANPRLIGAVPPHVQQSVRVYLENVRTTMSQQLNGSVPPLGASQPVQLGHLQQMQPRPPNLLPQSPPAPGSPTPTAAPTSSPGPILAPAPAPAPAPVPAPASVPSRAASPPQAFPPPQAHPSLQPRPEQQAQSQPVPAQP